MIVGIAMALLIVPAEVFAQESVDESLRRLRRPWQHQFRTWPD